MIFTKEDCHMKEVQVRIRDVDGKDCRLCNQREDGSLVFKNTDLHCTLEEAIKVLQSRVQRERNNR